MCSEHDPSGDQTVDNWGTYTQGKLYTDLLSGYIQALTDLIQSLFTMIG